MSRTINLYKRDPITDPKSNKKPFIHYDSEWTSLIIHYMELKSVKIILGRIYV